MRQRAIFLPSLTSAAAAICFEEEAAVRLFVLYEIAAGLLLLLDGFFRTAFDHRTLSPSLVPLPPLS